MSIKKRLVTFVSDLCAGDQLIAKRRNERFKRVKSSTLAKLLREQMVEESIYQLNKEGGQIGMQNGLQIGDSVSQVGA